MKAYYGSGLESIAQYAGYSDSALAKCANFKRTHFLAQSMGSSVSSYFKNIY